MATTDNPRAFINGIQALEDSGLILHPRQERDTFFVANARDGWARVAQEFSRNVGGMVYPRQDGITWNYSKSEQFYIAAHKSYRHIVDARRVIKPLDLRAGYTVQSCARALVDYVGEGTKAEKCHARLLEGIKLGYHDCAPGVYNYTTMYDVSRCYYQLLRRLPSLRATLCGNDLEFTGTPGAEWERWNQVLDLVAPAKRLSNTLWGVMLGGVDKGNLIAYHRGERKVQTVRPGKYHGVALLVGRTAWELNRQASEETNAVYSQTDCVITQDVKPTTWNSVGLDARLKHEGQSEICRRGTYCPDLSDLKTATEWYYKGSRLSEPVPLEKAPPVIYYRQWL